MCLMQRYGRNEKLGNNLRVTDLTPHLRMRKGENFYVQAKSVVDTLNRYMSSADELITTAHVPNARMDKYGQMKPIEHSIKMVKALISHCIYTQSVLYQKLYQKLA